MGNHVGIEKDPAALVDVLQWPSDGFLSPQKGGNLYKSSVHAWRFYTDPDDSQNIIKNAPVSLVDSFSSFDSRQCYLILHIMRDGNKLYTGSSSNSPSPPSSPSERGNKTPTYKPALPVSSLLASCAETLTPRGLSTCLEGDTFAPTTTTTIKALAEFKKPSSPASDSNTGLNYNMYIWNGRESTNMTRAVAMAKRFELVKALETKNLLRVLFLREDKVPLTSSVLFRIACDGDDPVKGGPLNDDNNNNHLFQQLLWKDAVEGGSLRDDKSKGMRSPKHKSLTLFTHLNHIFPEQQPATTTTTITPMTPTTSRTKKKKKDPRGRRSKSDGSLKGLKARKVKKEKKKKKKEKERASEEKEQEKKKKRKKTVGEHDKEDEAKTARTKKKKKKEASSSSSASSPSSPTSSSTTSPTATPTARRDSLTKKELPKPSSKDVITKKGKEKSKSITTKTKRPYPNKLISSKSQPNLYSATGNRPMVGFHLPLQGLQKDAVAVAPKLTLTAEPSIPLPPLTPKDNSSYDNNYFEEPEGALKAGKLRHFDPICSKITDDLYLGSETVAKNKDLLKENGVTHILNCAGSICPVYHPTDFTYRTLYLMDGVREDILCLLYDVIEWIDEAVARNGKVFIHCQQGVSRSSAIMVGYLMWKKDWAYEEAQSFVKKRRGVSSPNTGFIYQLLFLEKRLHELKRETRVYDITNHSLHDPKFLVGKNVRAPPSLEALDSSAFSSNCFIVQVPEGFYIWVGDSCNDDFVQVATQTVRRVQSFERATQNIHVVHQFSEGEEFRDLIRQLVPAH